MGGIVLLSFFVFAKKTSLLNFPFGSRQPIAQPVPYGLHKNITVTVFWVGEKAGFGNSFIPNSASAWDGQWKEHYGGTDSPRNRNGFYPADFAPMENPFYFALPYNDFDQDGQRKSEVYKLIPWVGGMNLDENKSICKNQWIKIIREEKIVYAQWEDVGPYGEDDGAYVFGDGEPRNGQNEDAGIDVSPAVRDYLGLEGIDKVDWQFVDYKDVPDGPWKELITTSQISWQ